MAPNIPEMYEAHFGVPMTGGVLNSLNTRLDAAMVAFIIDHSETKVLLVDREFHRVVDRGAGDRQDPAAGRRHRRSRMRGPRADRRHDLGGVHRRRRSGLRLGLSRRRMERDLAQLHVGHDRQSQGRGLQPSRRDALGLRQRHAMADRPASGLSLDPADVPLQRLVLPVDPRAGRRHLGLPAPPRRQDDLRRAGRQRRDAHVRRADHHAVHHRRHAGRAPAAQRARSSS